MSTQGIQATIKDIYNIDISPELVSRVTDEVKGLVEEWRNRPLESFYPVIFFDALRVNVRDEGHVSKKAIYLALAIRLDGQKELLGMWIERNEGAKFWMGIPSIPRTWAKGSSKAALTKRGRTKEKYPCALIVPVTPGKKSWDVMTVIGVPGTKLLNLLFTQSHEYTFPESVLAASLVPKPAFVVGMPGSSLPPQDASTRAIEIASAAGSFQKLFFLLFKWGRILEKYCERSLIIRV